MCFSLTYDIVKVELSRCLHVLHCGHQVCLLSLEHHLGGSFFSHTWSFFLRFILAATLFFQVRQGILDSLKDRADLGVIAVASAWSASTGGGGNWVSAGEAAGSSVGTGTGDVASDPVEEVASEVDDSSDVSVVEDEESDVGGEAVDEEEEDGESSLKSINSAASLPA